MRAATTIPSSLVRDNTMISPFADPEYKPATYYYTDAITDHAVRFVGDHAARPCRQAVLPVRRLHRRPLADARPARGHRQIQGQVRWRLRADPQGPLREGGRLGLIDPKQAMSPQAGDWDKVADKKWEAACMEVYAAMVDRMDQGIGKIVAELKRTGQLDNTLILFLQDNGGCAETMGRKADEGHPNIDRPASRRCRAMRPEEFAAAGSVPAQTRDGYPGPHGAEGDARAGRTLTSPTAGAGRTSPTPRSASTSTGSTRAASARR